MSFQEDLWGGLDVLTERMSEGKRTLKDMISFFQERAALEELYAKGLGKLHKTSLAGSHYATEKGSTGDAWNSVKGQVENLSKQHAEIGRQISGEVVQPLTAFKAKQATERQALIAQANKLQKEMDKMMQELAKAKAKYGSACKTAEQCQLQYVKQANDVNKQDTHKVLEKSQHAKQEATAAEQRYRDALADTRDKQESFKTEMGSVLAKMQELEEQRMEYVKEILKTFISVQEMGVASLQQGNLAMTAVVDQLSKEADLAAFIEEKRTGKSPDKPVEFQEYESQIEVPEVRPRARALYDYAAADESELDLKTDDIILVHSKDDGGWWQGELNGKVASFPSNYVEEIAPDLSAADAMSTTSGDRKEGGVGAAFRSIRRRSLSLRKKRQVRAVYDYDAQNDDELSLKEGDILVVESELEGWLTAVNADGKLGLCPANYTTAA